MNFKPKKDEELNTFELLPKGEYDFDVIKAKDELSKAGNAMITLELDIFASDGRKSRVFDYLLETVAYKLKHFCEAIGLTREYESGTLTAAMCANRSGRCLIVIQIDKTGNYSDKNIVKDYIKSEMEITELPDISEASLPF